MRATIKFEAEVNKVKSIMRSLVLEETSALGDAIDCMESIAAATSTSERLIEGIDNSLEHILGVVQQLEQYRAMVVSFELARLGNDSASADPPPPEDLTVSAAVAQALQSQLASVKQFDKFVGSIKHDRFQELDESPPRKENPNDTEEG